LNFDPFRRSNFDPPFRLKQVLREGRRQFASFRKRCIKLFFDQSGSLFLFQPVGLALDVDHGAVVEQPVQDGGGDDLIAEDFAPLAEAAITGHYVEYKNFLI